MSKFTVVFDACVLYPAPLRDILLELSTTELFRAKWSEDIHEEWISSLLAKREDLTREQLSHTRELMNQAVPDCLVEKYHDLIPTIRLPDSNDRHVVAAAIRCGADAIVSFNKKDFPVSALQDYNLELIHPDDFISYQFDLDLATSLNAARSCRLRLRNPTKTPEEYLSTLMRNSLTKTVSILEKYKNVL